MPKTYRLPNGLSASYLSKADTDIIYKEIFEEDVYRRHGVTIRDGDCVFDIGANTGIFLLFLNQVCQGAKVYACEPIPATFEVMSQNASRCDKLAVTAVNVGVSRQAGQATFTFYPRLSCASTMYPDESEAEKIRARDYIIRQFRELSFRPLAWLLAILPLPLKRAIAGVVHGYYTKKQSVTCELKTVSDLIREYQVERIDLLKVDVERSECDVLAGITEADWPRIAQAVVEVHQGGAVLEEVEQQFVRHGFQTIIDPNPQFPNIFMLYAVRPGAGR